MKKILIIGGGMREHALGLALRQHHLFFAPGNAGTCSIGENICNIDPYSDNIIEFAVQFNIDLVIIGPEYPLSLGLTDKFRSVGIPVFGPTKAISILETSKSFAKKFMHVNSIPTAQYEVFSSYKHACNFVMQKNRPFVVKADGLAAGKGVVVPADVDGTLRAIYDIMINRSVGEAGSKIVLEEILSGQEISFHIISDGNKYIVLPPARDYKRLLDNNLGPNTGGMGAVAPIEINKELYNNIISTIVEPTLTGMIKQVGTFFSGTLFFGLMIENNLPKVLEYNVRFGDPEAVAILPLYKGDWFDIFYQTAKGNLEVHPIFEGFSTAVVKISKEYPGVCKTGHIIMFDELSLEEKNNLVYGATSLEMNENWNVRTNGGRVMCALGIDSTAEKSRSKAYDLINKISWDGASCRTDIGII